MLRHPLDLVKAAHAGRIHRQRFFKNANVGGDGVWWDWSFASGLPAYDARIGVGLAFNPAIATKNDAIYFPPIPAGMQRQLAGITFCPRASNSGQTGITCEVYDLLGYYPLIDGDSTDLQPFDNTLALPRYTDGEGVIPVLVNHVAPIVAAANGTYAYTDSDGNARSSTFRAALTGVNRVVSAYPTAGGAGPISMPLANGARGVRSVDSIIFDAAPGGLFSLYLIRPMGSFVHYDDPINAAATAGTKAGMKYCYCIQNGWDMPTVYDGAHLGMFFMTNAGARTVSMFGNFIFTWG